MRVAILGSQGRLGAALARHWQTRHAIVPLARPDIDLADPAALRRRLEETGFDAAVNCAALTLVDACQTQRELAFTVNAAAPQVIAGICASRNVRLIQISTDYVFDGTKREPYTEDDEARPQSVYAESKYVGERRVLEASPDHIVARVSWVFGPDKPSFVDAMLDRAAASDRVAAVCDKWSCPTYTLDLERWLDALLDPAIAGGIYHLCNPPAATWQQYAQHAIDGARRRGVPLRAATVEPIPLAEMNAFVAPRGVYSAMATAKFTAATGIHPPPWRDAVDRYLTAKFSPQAKQGKTELDPDRDREQPEK